MLDRDGDPASSWRRPKPRIAIVGRLAEPGPAVARRAASTSRALGYDVVPGQPRARTRSPGCAATRRCAAAVDATGPVDIVDVFRLPPACPAHAREAVEVGAKVPVAPARHREPRGRPDRPRGRARGRHEPVPRRRGHAPVTEAVDAAHGDRGAPRSRTSIRAIVERQPADPSDGSVIHGRRGGRARSAARPRFGRGAGACWRCRSPSAMARPPISGFEVPAVGIEAGSGDLVLGANLEFPGTELGTTIHAEGFVALRARRRGRALATLVVREARPCAHCRQTLSESAAADAPGARRLAGQPATPRRPVPVAIPARGARRPGRRPGRRCAGPAWRSPADASAVRTSPACCLRSARGPTSPYSEAPSAVALRLGDGRLVGAGRRRERRVQPIDHARPRRRWSSSRRCAPSGSQVTEAWLARVAGAPDRPRGRLPGACSRRSPRARRPRVVDWARVGEEPDRAMVDRSSWWTLAARRRQRQISPPCGSPSACPGSAGRDKAARAARLDERFGAGRLAPRARRPRPRRAAGRRRSLEYEAGLPRLPRARRPLVAFLAEALRQRLRRRASRTSGATTTTSRDTPSNHYQDISVRRVIAELADDPAWPEVTPTEPGDVGPASTSGPA